MSPHRHVLIPVLIYCEGIHDQIFTRHLARMYKPKTSLYYFDIKHGDGGSPRSLVEKASKMPGGYNVRLTMFDNDRGEEDLRTAQAHAQSNSILVMYFTPSLEFVLLTILEPSKDFSTMTTLACKRYLHDKFIKENKRGNVREYEALFTREKLEAVRIRLPELDNLIGRFEA